MAEPSSPSEFVRACIVGVSQETPHVVGLRLQGPPDYEWIPGQHLALSAEVRGGALGYYSIASAPKQSEPGVLEIAAAVSSLPLGVRADQGQEVWISLPAGGLSVGVVPAPDLLVLIGMGTGVAPLRAMVQEWVSRASLTGVTLLQGARAESELLFRDEFNAYVEQGLDYRPVLSQPTTQWLARTGRVQLHLEDLDASARFRVCGSKEMVSDVKERLLKRGVPPQQIDGEGY